jgi:hypothetical protein
VDLQKDLFYIILLSLNDYLEKEVKNEEYIDGVYIMSIPAIDFEMHLLGKPPGKRKEKKWNKIINTNTPIT